MQNGKTYEVRTSPVFSYGDGNYGAPFTMFIVGTSSAEAQAAGVMFESEEIVDEAWSVEQEQVYPNPTAQSTVFIQHEVAFDGKCHVRLYAATGQCLLDRWVQLNSGFATPDLPAEISNGVYLLTMNSDNGLSHQRLVVNR